MVQISVKLHEAEIIALNTIQSILQRHSASAVKRSHVIREALIRYAEDLEDEEA